ncbi:MAG: 16S rRNA (uracil(1498)-N(3))-methyltransferase [Deltaproteobacteria bacterium]|nr:16S rRNA (uracil(1498)-N(3))-methyltransferase [Deltaproteobacteria bacterium]
MTRLLLETVPSPPSTVEVEGDELRYLARVRRHGAGDPIEVRDAEGQRFAARVASVGKKCARLDIERQLPMAPRAWPVKLLVAVPKGARLDDVVRKLSELGVAELTPVIAERSNTRPGQGRLKRWRRIAAESTRQCGRRKPLSVSDAVTLADGLAENETAAHKLILDPGAGDQGLTSTFGSRRIQDSVVIAIGPEGGFTASELKIAKSLGFATTGLGPTILRVDTAAIAAATLAVAALGGFD